LDDIRVGIDRTASELAINRLSSEIKTLQKSIEVLEDSKLEVGRGGQIKDIVLSFLQKV